MNVTGISGNVVSDPEKVEYGEGKLLANFRFANNELVNGEQVSNGFFDVTVFGPQAAHVLESLHKGDRVVITGRLQHSTYDKPDGSRGGRTKIIATELGASLLFGPVKVPARPAKTADAS
jgi:single-strand DNA-binding protein